jgi:hypothetical protein
MAMIQSKSQKLKKGHGIILSIGIFIDKNHILLLQLPGNWPTTKKCAPYFRGNMEFPIYFDDDNEKESIENIKHQKIFFSSVGKTKEKRF